MKQLWMLVGGNGAGKTTFYEQFLQPKNLPFINADLIAKELFPKSQEESSLKAAKLAEQIRMENLREGNNFCFETVFSHPSKIDFIATAKALGYRIYLIWIHVEHAELNVARVAQRVEDGGHSVPEDKIHTRIPKMIENVKQAMVLCDEVLVFDNSRLDNPFQLILSIIDGEVTYRLSDPLPKWVEPLV